VPFPSHGVLRSYVGRVTGSDSGQGLDFLLRGRSGGAGGAGEGPERGKGSCLGSHLDHRPSSNKERSTESFPLPPAWPTTAAVNNPPHQRIRRSALCWATRQRRRSGGLWLRARAKGNRPLDIGRTDSACHAIVGVKNEGGVATCGHHHRAEPLTPVVRGRLDRSPEALLRPSATCAQGARPPGCDRDGLLHRTARRGGRGSSDSHVRTLVDR